MQVHLGGLWFGVLGGWCRCLLDTDVLNCSDTVYDNKITYIMFFCFELTGTLHDKIVALK